MVKLSTHSKRLRSRVVSDNETKPKRRRPPPPSESDDDDENDPDYNPEEDDSEYNTDDSEYETDSDEDEADDEDMQTPIIMLMDSMNRRSRRRMKNVPEFAKGYSKDELDYYLSLNDEEKSKVAEKEATIQKMVKVSDVPVRFRILQSEIPDTVKATFLRKLEQVQQMEGMSSEYFKLNQWLDAAMRLPLGKYANLSIQSGDASDKIAEFLQTTRTNLDKNVYGHHDAKVQILRILAQWISKPGSKGNVIGIQGPMGCGKTSLVKKGISQALGLPFAFVGLGGASDGSFLEGHSYTYEGSMYGKIAELLIKAQCMNPIIFFDELDKVSETPKGTEVYNILVHLTDSSQNDRYNDRYFSELDLDLSKTLLVFSYNDESKINPILLDRMIKIRIPNGYTTKEKVHIAIHHLIPELIQEFGLETKDILLTESVLEYLISKVPTEEGVRNLKRGLECIISWVNMLRYIPAEETGATPITLPFTVTEEFVKKYLMKEDESGGMKEHVAMAMYM
jgi:ATP-dependent Lon protease